eukprot:m.25134 g.25134  ORF g.25134 m.25134 type:complete len:911 (+) comp28746_c0_seq1:187-2919(+)
MEADDQMDQGIVPDRGSGTRMRGSTEKVRSHQRLIRSSSKPERGSKQSEHAPVFPRTSPGNFHSAGEMSHVETRNALRNFIQQRREADPNSATKGACPPTSGHSSAFHVLPNVKKETIWSQGSLALHAAQHHPDQLAILNTPYKQSEGSFPLRKTVSDPDIENDKKKFRFKGSDRRPNNSPIPKKREGSLKRKVSNVEVPVITGGGERGSSETSIPTSPSVSPSVGNHRNDMAEDVEMGAGDSAVCSATSQLSVVHESDSAISSINSLPLGGFSISVNHPPVMQSASWPQPPSATDPPNLIPFHPQLAQQMALLGGHKPLQRMMAGGYTSSVGGIPHPRNVRVLPSSPTPPSTSDAAAAAGGVGRHKRLVLSRSEPPPGQMMRNPIELQMYLQWMRTQHALQQTQLLDSFVRQQEGLQLIQRQGEEQYHLRMLELEREYKREELLLERQLEFKQQQLLQAKQQEALSESQLQQPALPGQATGLAYDQIMLKHDCLCKGVGTHHEFSGRLQSIYSRLQATGIVDQCQKLKPRKATDEELKTIHSENHVQLYGKPIQQKMPLEGQLSGGRTGMNPMKTLRRLPCGGYAVDDDTVWNDAHTSSAARTAAGCVIDLALKVANGDLKNGFAVVRPPGHHAEPQQPMGFCYFNNVSVAAKAVLAKTDLRKVAIVDWDVHHGNGTQHAFLDDPDVLYISVHRHDEGNFFPGTGSIDEVGVGSGLGTNVNIPFNGGLNPSYGDPEYLAAFRGIIIPILKQFDPDIILVSAGFDACMGHAPNLGGYMVTPSCFGYMTKQLMNVGNGKVVLALEGGYELKTICECSEICFKALLGEEIPPIPSDNFKSPPHERAIQMLEQCRLTQSQFWSCMLRREVPAYISKAPSDAEQIEREMETANALAGLSLRAKQFTDGRCQQDL